MIMPFYNGGYKDLPDTTTPISAAAMNYAEAPKLLGGGLFINGNFDIWQRGTSFVSAAAAYKADRWEVTGTTTTVNRITNTSNLFDAKYTFEITSAGVINLRQKLENPHNVLYDKESTLSFWVKADVARTLTARLRNDTQAVTIGDQVYNVTTGFTKITINFPASTQWAIDDVIEVRIINSNDLSSDTIEFANVRFEVGGVGTAFLPKTFAEELEDCHRYYQVFSSPISASPLAYGYNTSATRALVAFPLVTPMRVLPTVIRTGTERLRSFGASFAPTTFSVFYNPGEGLVTASIEVAAGLTANQLTNYTIDDNVVFDAEL